MISGSRKPRGSQVSGLMEISDILKDARAPLLWAVHTLTSSQGSFCNSTFTGSISFASQGREMSETAESLLLQSHWPTCFTRALEPVTIIENAGRQPTSVDRLKRGITAIGLEQSPQSWAPALSHMVCQVRRRGKGGWRSYQKCLLLQ